MAGYSTQLAECLTLSFCLFGRSEGESRHCYVLLMTGAPRRAAHACARRQRVRRTFGRRTIAVPERAISTPPALLYRRKPIEEVFRVLSDAVSLRVELHGALGG